MSRIPDETIQTIRDKVDLVELIGRFVALRQAGRNFKGLCPFHDEKTPSFNVNPDRGIFHCFGCGAGGNAFGFLMRHENLTFPEAARELARQTGVEIRDEGPRERGVSERLRAANDAAQAFFRTTLAEPGGAAGRAYLERRGIDAASVDHFQMGFAPEGWDGLVQALRRAGIPESVGVQAGLLAERRGGSGHYDRLRGRVVFPILDARGRVIGFGGRAVSKEQEPKYLNTPESPIYKKREALFGLATAREPMQRAGRALVVEGYFDVVALWRAGVREAVATCGTSLTAEHARELRRRTREVVLLFDGDDAGHRAVAAALEVLLPQGLRVRAASLPRGEDPDSLLARAGAEALRGVVDAAAPALEVSIRRACGRGLATPWERADAVHAVAPLVARVPDPVERGEFGRQLAMAAGVSESDVASVVQAAVRGERMEDAAPPPPRRVGPEDRRLRTLAQMLVQHPALAPRISTAELEELLPDAPLLPLVTALLTAGSGADLEDRLDDALRPAYTALLADESPRHDEPTAAQVIDDTLSLLRADFESRERRRLTREARDGVVDAETYLRLKSEQLDARRKTTRLPPGAVKH